MARLEQPLGVDLVVARGQAAQQDWIDHWLAQWPSASRWNQIDDARLLKADQRPLGIVAEGAFFELAVASNVLLERLAAGCVCCVGWVPLKVVLTRLIRRQPQRLLLLLASDDHLPRVQQLLGGGELGVNFDVQLAAPFKNNQPDSDGRG